MYLIYNREYELVGEAKDFSQVKDIIGEDIQESNVDSLEFIRGKTVILEDSLKRVLHEIVAVEKDEVVDYLTEEVENHEDETVELKTTNRLLQNKIVESKEYLSELSAKIGRAVNQTSLLTDLGASGHHQEKGSPITPTVPPLTPVQAKTNTPKEKVSDEFAEEYDTDELDDSRERSEKEDVKGLDDETRNILQHIERNHKVEGSDEGVKSASKIIPNRRKQSSTSINFISIIDGGKVKQIKDLKGKTLIKTTKLSQDVGLDREHVEFLIDNVLRDCGGTPKYQNKNVVSPAEAVWIIVSALTKRDGFVNNQRFQKTKENAEDFYESWEQQKDEINAKLG